MNKPNLTYKELIESMYPDDRYGFYVSEYSNITPGKIHDDGSIDFYYIDENEVKYIMSGQTKRWRKSE